MCTQLPLDLQFASGGCNLTVATIRGCGYKVHYVIICSIYNPQEHNPRLPVYATSLWGPTCDGLDKIGDVFMAELNVGDWIYFDNMGAYTVAAASSFNGFLKPKTHYYVTEANL